MSRKPYPSNVADQFVVRFPPGLRAQIKDIAALNRRSMNAEIVFHLENAIGAAGEGLGNSTPAADQTTL